MNGKRKLLIGLLMAVLLGGILAGLLWHQRHYVMIDFKFYPRDAQVLDLRGQDVSPAMHDKLQRQLPQCQIRWDIPFQGKTYPDTTDTLTVTALSQSDIHTLSYFQALKTVEAEGCTDYDSLLALVRRRPDVTVRYSVPLDGVSYKNTAEAVEVTGLTEAELALLDYLPELKAVTVTGGGSGENLGRLQSWCRENGLTLNLRFGEQSVPDTADSLELDRATDADLALLPLLKNLKQLQLNDPQAAAETVTALPDTYPRAEIRWNKSVWGTVCDMGVQTLDLSEAAAPGTVEEVETAMAYFPTLTEVFLGKTELDNEEIAAYRERHREDYKVVWTVGFRNKLFVRSDVKDFFPCRDGLCNFNDEDAVNLKYCEEIQCMDIGHMPIHEVDFLEYMPDMKYLILSWTQVKRIDAVQNCKKLIFLEVTDCPLRSLEGVQGCTALEDLNFGATWPDVTPILEMTWLKRVYMIQGSGNDAAKIAQALPDTTVVASGNATVGGGWRRMQNYYDMRDFLGVPYMN